MAKLRNLFHPKQQLAPKILLPQARQAEERQEGAMGVKYLKPPKALKSRHSSRFLRFQPHYSSRFLQNEPKGRFFWLVRNVCFMFQSPPGIYP